MSVSYQNTLTVFQQVTVSVISSSVHEINIEISEEDWQDLLAHPVDKTKFEVSVAIDGVRYEQVK